MLKKLVSARIDERLIKKIESHDPTGENCFSRGLVYLIKIALSTIDRKKNA